MIEWKSPTDSLDMPDEWRDERPLVAWVKPHNEDLKDLVLGCFYDSTFNFGYVCFPNGEDVRDVGTIIAIAEANPPENLDV